MAEDEKEKKDKESPQSWWGLGVLAIALILSISVYLLWPAKKPQRLVSAQPAVVEKTCPEDPSKCPVCEGAANVTWQGKEKEQTLSAQVGCWSGYSIIISKQEVHSLVVPTGLVWTQYDNGDLYKSSPAIAPANAGYRPNGSMKRFMAIEKSETVRIKIAKDRQTLYRGI